MSLQKKRPNSIIEPPEGTPVGRYKKQKPEASNEEQGSQERIRRTQMDLLLEQTPDIASNINPMKARRQLPAFLAYTEGKFVIVDSHSFFLQKRLRE